MIIESKRFGSGPALARWFVRVRPCSRYVLAALPKSAHPAAKKYLAEIRGAEGKTHAFAAVKAFVDTYRANFAKAVAKITDDVGELLAFYDNPAEHWVDLRTTNPIDSTFRDGPASEQDHPRAGVEGRWVGHRLKADHGRAGLLARGQRTAPHLVALVRAGATFVNGKLGEREQPRTPPIKPAT
jgi:putative transposase